MRKQIWESLNCKQKKWHSVRKNTNYRKKRKTTSKMARCFFFFGVIWLGYCDSNTGMSESESDALPLGDTPKFNYLFIITQKEQKS